MKKLKIYLDTSVISHLEGTDAPYLMQSTLELWEILKNNIYEIYISDLVIAEIDECYEPKKTKLYNSLKLIEFHQMKTTKEIELLAEKYIAEKIIKEKYFDDALHIAHATILNCNAIISWNFKHMVNIKTILGINGINTLLGYNQMEILTPGSLLEKEE